MAETIPDDTYHHLVRQCEDSIKRGANQVLLRFVNESPPSWFPQGTPIKAAMVGESSPVLEIIYDAQKLLQALVRNKDKVWRRV